MPAGGNPLNKCTAHKVTCLRKYGACILSRVRKAAAAGTAIGDVSKCARSLSSEEGNCVAKLEAKYCTGPSCQSTRPPCLTFDDAIRLRKQDDAFTDDAIYALAKGPTAPNTQRCTGDTSVTCLSAPGGVAGCGGPLGTCEFFVSPPQAYGGGGIPYCMTRRWIGSITGTFDQETGASTGTATVLTNIFFGVSSAHPCPRCQGDPFPNDGVSAGTCSAGIRNGLACDGNGQAPEPSFGITSFDCPPSGSSMGEQTLDLANSTAGITKTVTASSPNCQGAPGKKCLCGSCSGNLLIPCTSDADCALAGAGTCGVATGGEPQKPSACVDATQTPADGALCAPSGNGDGRCLDGPWITRCRLERHRTCSPQFQALDCPLPGDTCEIEPVECFPGYDGNVGDTITASGRPGELRNGATPMAFGAVFCIPPTSSSWVNVAGFPGPGRLEFAGVAEDDGGPGCPTRASFLPTSRGPTLDSGWRGFDHDLPWIGQTMVTVATTCTGTYPSCQCSYTGPIANPNAP